MTDYDIHLDDKFGSLALIDPRDRETVVLDPHQGYTVPKASSIGRARRFGRRS